MLPQRCPLAGAGCEPARQQARAAGHLPGHSQQVTLHNDGDHQGPHAVTSCSAVLCRTRCCPTPGTASTTPPRTGAPPLSVPSVQCCRRCWPPPWLVPAVSAAQLGLYCYYGLQGVTWPQTGDAGDWADIRWRLLFIEAADSRYGHAQAGQCAGLLPTQEEGAMEVPVILPGPLQVT